MASLPALRGKRVAYPHLTPAFALPEGVRSARARPRGGACRGCGIAFTRLHADNPNFEARGKM